MEVARVLVTAAAAASEGRGCGGGTGGPGWAPVAPRVCSEFASCRKRSPVICTPQHFNFKKTGFSESGVMEQKWCAGGSALEESPPSDRIAHTEHCS